MQTKVSIDTIDWQFQRTFEMKFCEIKLTHVAKKKKERKTLHENITDCLIILYVGCPRFFYQTLSLYSMERDKEKSHINVCH